HRALREQRPLPAELAREHGPHEEDPPRARLASPRPDHLVRAHWPRPVEPAPREDARPLRAALRAQVRGQAAAAPGALGRSGAAPHRPPLPGAAQRLAPPPPTW